VRNVQSEVKVMRDALIERLFDKMQENEKIFLISADFGAPALDKLRENFKDRFINVGIAEQNLVNISAGLALEGFIVYAYAIAPFITMRAYEQIRVNLSLLSHTREINVNLIGVGGGLSYDVAGPTHHCIEDISIMRVLPNLMVCSPSDWALTEKFVDFSINVNKPKYIRLDGKQLPRIYHDPEEFNIENGFHELVQGKDVCLVSTGYMTHKALHVANKLRENNINIGVIDVFLLKPFNEDLIYNLLEKYEHIITLEEAFINKGGLDSMISCVLSNKASHIKLKRLGFGDKYVFDIGSRDYFHKLNNIDEEYIIKVIENASNNISRRTWNKSKRTYKKRNSKAYASR